MLLPFSYLVQTGDRSSTWRFKISALSFSQSFHKNGIQRKTVPTALAAFFLCFLRTAYFSNEFLYSLFLFSRTKKKKKTVLQQKNEAEQILTAGANLCSGLNHKLYSWVVQNERKS